MLTINTRNDKLAAARNNFLSCGMLNGTCLGEVVESFQHTCRDTNDSNSNTANISDDNGDYDQNADDGQDGDDGQDLGAGEDGEDDQDRDLDNDEDEDRAGPVAGPPTQSEVTLARKRGGELFFATNLIAYRAQHQHAAILSHHFGSLASVSSKKTLKISFVFSYSTNRTPPPPVLLQ